MDPHRQERISQSIREELEEMIGYELADPRIGEVSVTEVLLAPDSRQAHVRLSLGGNEAQQADTLAAVNHAKQYLKLQLGERLQLYKTPDLHFEADLPGTMAARVPQLLKRMRRGRAKE